MTSTSRIRPPRQPIRDIAHIATGRAGRYGSGRGGGGACRREEGRWRRGQGCRQGGQGR